MDINFLKHLTPNVGYLFPKNQITLSSTPAVDIVNVGISQIIKQHSLYVPIYGPSSRYTIQKTISQPCQYGGSNENSVQDSTSLQSSVSHDVEIPLLNKNKRKMSDAVISSFQNPVIQTNTLNLSPLVDKSEPKLKKHKNLYKFKIID